MSGDPRPTVTVLIPTCNRRELLGQSLASVLAQTCGELEVLVSDNGSTDGTEELLAAAAAADPRLRVHRFPHNVGPAANWEYLLSSVTTEFAALLPDDDLLLPDHLEHALAALRHCPAASIYCCRAEYFGTRIGVLVGPHWLADARGPTVHDARTDALPWLFGNPVAIASVVFRGRVLESVDLCPDDIFACGDWLLWGQIALQGEMLFDPAVRVRYRWHAANDSLRALRGRRLAAQQRFVIRELATRALRQGALDVAALRAEVGLRWPEPEAAAVVVALASFDSNPRLREAAKATFLTRSGHSGWRASLHCRIAERVGLPYLVIADAVDRIVGRWWRPRRRRRSWSQDPSRSAQSGH